MTSSQTMIYLPLYLGKILYVNTTAANTAKPHIIEGTAVCVEEMKIYKISVGIKNSKYPTMIHLIIYLFPMPLAHE